MGFFSVKGILGGFLGKALIGLFTGNPFAGFLAGQAGSFIGGNLGENSRNWKIKRDEFEVLQLPDVIDAKTKKAAQARFNAERKARILHSGVREPLILVLRDPKTGTYAALQRLIAPATTPAATPLTPAQQRHAQELAKKAEKKRQREALQAARRHITP